MKKLVVAVSAIALAAGAWIVTKPARPEAPAHLLDRVWIDHVPDSPTDMVHHLLVLKDPQGPGVGGVLGASSQWHVGLDLFQRKLGADHMRLFFPQRKKAFVVNVKTWRCEGDAPQPFQLCLELSAKNGKHKHRLYSRDDWTIDSSELPDEIAAFAVVPQTALLAAQGASVTDEGEGEDATMEVEALPPPLSLPPRR
jgi:hypothetical protein